MIIVIGGRGFVGSAYVRLFEKLKLEHLIITRENYAKHIGKSCDILINANGNSSKLLADREPKRDFDSSVRSVLHSLEDFKAGAYVLLSSGDVYSDQSFPAFTTESSPIDTTRQSRYGFHKYLAELIVRQHQPRWLIMRMGGFVGPGMKKNAVFDMLGDKPVWLHPDSELQFISTDTAAGVVWNLVQKGITREIVNLGARGVIRLTDLHRRIKSISVFQPEARKVRFEISLDKLATLSAFPIPETAAEVENFLQNRLSQSSLLNQC